MRGGAIPAVGYPFAALVFASVLANRERFVEWVVG
jgi:hypothetical protein